MRVILTEDVPKLGHAGEVVKVKPGYGRNYLLPQGKALLATAGRVKSLEHQRRVIEEKVKKEVALHQQTASELAKVSLSFEMQSNEEGRLFGSVTNGDIQLRLAELGFAIDRRRIELAEPIKSVGSHQVEVRLHREVQVPISVTVTSAGTPVAEPLEEPSPAEQAMLEAEAKAEEEEGE